jgi:hypothetical protein
MGAATACVVLIGMLAVYFYKHEEGIWKLVGLILVWKESSVKRNLPKQEFTVDKKNVTSKIWSA